ncbi:MAG: hypothetical protein M1814_001380 [Vezdaea aestivalis]|nr:MAG: hypothetical protein M1814_001380 [Vezdaea aestivalis]
MDRHNGDQQASRRPPDRQQQPDPHRPRPLREQPAAPQNRSANTTSRASTAKSTGPSSHPTQPPHSARGPPIQHHESMQTGGQLQTLPSSSRPGSASPAATNPRLSAVASDGQASNRNSQISTTSTTASSKSKQKTHIGPWRLGRTLGKGSTARVRLAKHEITGQLAAIKIVSKKAGSFTRSHSLANDKMKALMREDETEQARRLPFGIEREVVIMKLIEHPNVIQLYDVWENRNELYLVLEYVDGGELWQHLYDRGRFGERQAVGLFRQILSAISHCHQFNICHRDMKPENILLDKDGNIKLADFGMAALQPQGVMLLTSCGSPHYAAPELLEGKQYNGSKVDVWAIGVILYSLLAGSLPFDGSSVPSLLAKILKGKYYMPPEFSAEARGLIGSLLQSKPEKRLNVNDIWHQPLLLKYSSDALAVVDGLERWIGPPPPISPDDIGRPVHRSSDIDREILRNLQTLWHGEDADVLVRRLLSREHNQEKTFYYLLMKYRDQSLEDYQGPGMMNYSASDYHHASSTPYRSGAYSSQQYTRIDSRQGSRYSIVSRDFDKMELDERDEIRTEKSYDPFRASREPVINQGGDYNVTILRQQSNAKRSRAGSVAKHSVISRAQESHMGTRHSSRSSIRSSRGRSAQQIPSAGKRTGSKTSLRSYTKGKPDTIVRPRQSGKREVAFNHSLRNSTKPEPEAAAAATPVQKLRTARTIPASPDTVLPSSPPVLCESPESPIPVKTHGYGVLAQAPAVRQLRADSTIWKDATRKASVELGVLIDEAFKPRSSIGSSIITTETDGVQLDYKTPVSSYSSPDSSSPKPASAVVKSKAETRPLPTRPHLATDQMGMEELEKTKMRLMARAAAQRDGPSRAYLDDMIERLDRMMSSTLPPPDIYSTSERRTASDSQASQAQEVRLSGLRMNDPNDFSAPDPALASNRHVSAPVSYSRPAHGQSYERTIRMVDPTSSTVEPLNFRKKQRHTTDSDALMSGAVTSSTSRQVYDPRSEVRHSSPSLELETIQEDAERTDPRVSKHESIEKDKKRSWWRRSEGSAAGDRPKSSSSSKEDWPLADEGKKSRKDEAVWVNDDTTLSPRKPKRSIFHLFSKRRAEPQRYSHTLTTPSPLDHTSDLASLSSSTDFRTSSIAPAELFVHDAPSPTLGGVPRPIVPVPQSWFARILHIRPKTKILCFSVGRRRARREIVAVLRDWRKYGMRDIVQDRERNVCFARVDEKNFLKIKPVSLAAECLTILQDGKRAGLSTARFTQEKGAASSFTKVIETLERVLRNRGVLVDDQVMIREMVELTKVVGGLK